MINQIKDKLKYIKNIFSACISNFDDIKRIIRLT